MRNFVGRYALVIGLLACGPQAETPAPETPAPEMPVAETETAAVGAIDGARVAAADSEPEQWLAHGRTHFEQRYSPLASIHKGNVMFSFWPLVIKLNS